ncbi:hypothetical protein [Celeribacter naphthalenivorans]|uniref:hypothetical protein n=1 Tax=Celeribacter naphthalenivorans TaxID=1614694 RepID=UPI001CFAE6DC|nr:hypothetical protein [Celeribacter naphthalenivorans]
MGRKVMKSGFKTHDVFANWSDDEGEEHNELVGIRSCTNTNESVEILFVKFPAEKSVITAYPIESEDA